MRTFPASCYVQDQHARNRDFTYVATYVPLPPRCSDGCLCDALRVATAVPRTSAISMGLSVGDKFPDSALKVTHAARTMSSRLRTRCLQPQLLKLTRP